MQPESLSRSLQEHEFIAGLDEPLVSFLAACTRNQRFEARQFLFREGESADTLYLIRKGQVALESSLGPRGAVTVETVEAGSVIGWSTLFPPYTWHLDGRALTPTVAFAIDGKCLRPKLEQDPRFGYLITRRLLQHVSRRLARARLQQLDIYKNELKSEKLP